MWDCTECGCRSIAAGLESCPMCGRVVGVPKATSGGASNAWEQQPEPEVIGFTFGEEDLAVPDPAPEQPAAVVAEVPAGDVVEAPAVKVRKATS